jgi:hypothetical protein
MLKKKMEEEVNDPQNSNINRMLRDQLITISDLQVFKKEMIDEIKKLLWQNGVHPVKKWLKSHEVCRLHRFRN